MTDLEPIRAVQLHLLRHAHAGDPYAWDGPDEVRPLSPRGERQADRLGRFLAGVGFRTDAIITSPANGTITGTPPNVTYTPSANFNGSDSFTFRVNDGITNSTPATITITVTAVNDAPT